MNGFKLIAFAIGLLLLAPNTSVDWKGNHKYDKGIFPAIAANDYNVVLECHETNNITVGDMWYHVGVFQSDGTINWAQSHKLSGDGLQVNVGLSTQAAVAVYHDVNHRLFFQVGRPNNANNDVNWSDPYQYDRGQNPAIAINNKGVLVEVHHTDSNTSAELYYKVGHLMFDANRYPSGIRWGDTHYYDTGFLPTVTLNDNGTLVEDHNGTNPGLYARVGQVNSDDTITFFGEAQKYDNGYEPHVALRNDGSLIEVHQSDSKTDLKLWYYAGSIQGTSINFGPVKQLTAGVDPAVTVNNRGLAAQVHAGDFDHTDLWYEVGQMH